MDTPIGRGLYGSTVERLGQRIVSGAVAEGEVLDVLELQREFDISQTVIREALRVLAAKGLIAARQKHGTYVRPRSEWQVLDGDVLRWQSHSKVEPRFFDDLNELRAIVEPACARLAAERRTDEDLQRLEAHLQAMTDATGDPASAVQADLAFHRALLHATHNQLMKGLEALIHHALAARDRLVHDAIPREDATPPHRAVFDEVRDGDPDAAEDAMRRLIARSVDDLARIDGRSARRPTRRRSASNASGPKRRPPRSAE
jgi:GntR family transcriptional regulator, galactonate operon transcriptional repressor